MKLELIGWLLGFRIGITLYAFFVSSCLRVLVVNLSEIAAQRFQAAFDRFDRSGERKAHVTFAVRAKDHARHRGHLGAVKQSFRRFTTVATDARHVREGVKS